MRTPSTPSGFLRRRGLTASWDVAMPLMGLVFLFLEVSPRPIFAWNLASAAVLLQFPILGAAFLAAREKRLALAIIAASCLALLQSFPGVASSIAGDVSFEALFPLLAWAAMLLSYAHPARREVYFGKANKKESST
jgi:hypothetical protein